MSIVLFDFDFTIGDSSKAILECFRYALESCGQPVPDDQAMLATIGMPLKDTFSLLAPDGDLEQILERYRERSREIMVAWALVYDKTPKVVGAIRSRGYLTGIVTGKSRRTITGILERDLMTHLFDVIVGSEDVSRGKPHPDGIELAVRQLGGDCASATYVGDAVVDLKAARAAGAKFVGVSTGPTPAEDLASHGVPVVGSLNDLLDHFPARNQEHR